MAGEETVLEVETGEPKPDPPNGGDPVEPGAADETPPAPADTSGEPEDDDSDDDLEVGPWDILGKIEERLDRMERLLTPRKPQPKPKPKSQPKTKPEEKPDEPEALDESELPEEPEATEPAQPARKSRARVFRR